MSTAVSAAAGCCTQACALRSMAAERALLQTLGCLRRGRRCSQLLQQQLQQQLQRAVGGRCVLGSQK